MTLDQIQTALAKGKLVMCPKTFGNNPITLFQATDRFITIQSCNVRRFGLGALDFFLNNTIIY